MKVTSGLIFGVTRLSRKTADISKEAQRRLKWFDYYYSHGQNARLTCRHFDISLQTFYRWKRRYDPSHLESLEERSRRPRNVRKPQAPPELVNAVLKMREEYPCWGKEKIAVLLREQGFGVSSSAVGRILARLKLRGVLREPPRNRISATKKAHNRPYAIRKPKDYEVKAPGDLVQLDTLDVRPLPGVVLKHFTARDVISRWDVVEIYTRATAITATRFLDKLEGEVPFPIKAIQVDGGSEFRALFEEECNRRNIKLFILPPHSPELNGYVERAHRTHTEEFYEVTDSTFELDDLREELSRWQRIYNTVRPHQSLGYLTPLKFLEQWRQNQRKEVRCH